MDTNQHEIESLIQQGTLEAVPFYPHEFIQRQSSMRLVDPSAMVIEDVDVTQLDPLQRLREEHRLTPAALMPSVQKTEANVRATLEKLVETGFLEPYGTGRGRTYTLSAALYRKAGKKSEYIRQAGFAPIQQEQMVLNYIDKHDSIKRADTADLCRISPFQATRLLKRLEKRDLIKSSGQGKGTRYERK